MHPNRSLSHNLLKMLIFLLVYYCIFFSPVYAETEYPPVDTDYDTDVDSDGLDFYNFIEEYGRVNCSAMLPCWFDFNFDEKVDDSDLSDFAKDFGRAGIDVYESDDSFDQAKIVVLDNDKYQLHNFHQDQEGDEDWMMFFALKDETYEIEVVDVDFDVSLELYKTDGSPPLEESKNPGSVDEWIRWTSPDDGLYYVRVYPANPSDFGAITRYNFAIYRPIGSLPGTIYGIVKNKNTQSAISKAIIRTNAGGSAISFPNGVYIIAQHPPLPPPQQYMLTATAAGFSSYIGWITVLEGGITRKDIEMTP